MRRKSQIQISIPEPCHQSWQAMLPEGQGRFCNHCQKTVTDFTGMSDAEIVRMLSQANGPTCGRLRNTQLNRPIVIHGSPSARSWPRLAAGAVVLLMAMPHALLAQAPAMPASEIGLAVNGNTATKPNTSPGSSEFILKGHLIDAETGVPIPFATVKLRTLGVGAFTDENGSFSFGIPLERAADTIALEARAMDGEYEASITLQKNDLPSEMTIALHRNNILDISVGVMVVRPRNVDITVDDEPQPLFGPRKNKRPSKPSK